MNSKIKVWTPHGYINFIHSTFPAGEEYVQIVEKYAVNHSGTVIVHIYDASSSTIITACLIADAIRQISADVTIIADFSYLPYGRQDRVCSEGESFSLKFFIDLLNLRFNKVQAYDVHSEVSAAYVTQTTVPHKYIDATTNEVVDIRACLPVNYVGVAPDNGAKDRVKDCDKKIFLQKTRKEGAIEISAYGDTAEEVIRNSKDFVIFDDICDGGGTFITALDYLRSINPDARVYLVVTHGIFSKGLEPLSDFERILTADNHYNRLRLA